MAVWWAVRKGDALYPDSAESAAELAKLPIGKPIRIETRRPRNAGHHRLFWLLVHRIAAAVGSEPDTVADLLKIETGHYTVIRSKKYGEIRLPRSISFATMDQDAFNDFFQRCVVVICETWGTSRKDVLAAVEDLLNPTEAR